MKPSHFRRHVIRPTLKGIGLWSLAAENLLLGTAMTESGLFYLAQVGGGPALGVYQVEPATHRDIVERFLLTRRNAKLQPKVLALLAPEPDGEAQLKTNLAYATAIARLRYLMDPQPLPPADDVEALARYWKRVYNTEYGAGRTRDFVERYRPYHVAVDHPDIIK